MEKPTQEFVGDNEAVWFKHLEAIERMKAEAEEMPEPFKKDMLWRIRGEEINLNHTKHWMGKDAGYFNCSLCGVAAHQRTCTLELSVEDKPVCSMCLIQYKRWQEKLSGNHHKIIIDFNVYNDGGNCDKPKNATFLGYGGSRFNIVMDTGERISTNNLWNGGTVPWRYRHDFPNNAKFAHQIAETQGNAGE